MRSRSNYTNSFLGEPGKKDDYKYIPDNLKTGTNWFGNSHYSDKFREPNPEDYAKKYKIIEKKEDNPDYCHQYGNIHSNYRNHLWKKFLRRSRSSMSSKSCIVNQSQRVLLKF